MISSTFKKASYVLALSAWITSTDAQVANCTSTSRQCCWVVRIWQLMGQTTNVSSTSTEKCCTGIGGVVCSSSRVTQLNWAAKNLRGAIPSDIGNLINLTKL